ncbi:hypothetical protein [Bradyrhizobium yuanmingense]|uniref:hypothetical protein n=1 Tax=Bradyrhizobium yuanmingense TaxID=108015 RepID=UPI0023B8A6D0|nr:hypothetical protein [Bradyrhizobium yuanmingense]MDF0584470.1 hypothetical protein [Bradyrhizobium yuanmingense]
MKREQAVRINDHLLDAYRALDEARMGIAALGKAERIELGDWLEEVVTALEDELSSRSTISTRIWSRQNPIENR